MTRLSHSAIEKYDSCGYKYYLHYILKYRSSKHSSALLFGNALDLALNEMLEGRDTYHSVFDSEWNNYAEFEIEYYSSDLDEGLLSEQEALLSLSKRQFISMGYKGHLLLDAYFKEVMPRIKKVLDIQGEMNLTGYDDAGNPTEDSITGKLDLIAMIEDNDGNVVHALLDNKTTSQPYPKNSVQKKDQLALYACAYPDIKTFGYLTMNKKNFKTQVILDSISEEKKETVLTKFVTALENIKNNIFERNKKSCYAFGRRCEYYSHCHQGYFAKDIYQKTEEK
jgi:RecB family exonuclease